MRSRRDQVHAYAFLNRRTTDALVAGSADSIGPHLQRLTRTQFSGVMAGLVALAGFGVAGLVSPGSARHWQRQDGVVIEKETGARYAWYAGTLHPSLNYASARLAVGPDKATSRVSRRSLSGVARDPRTSGIDGAPDSLPGAGSLLTAPWSVCSSPVLDAAGDAGTRRSTTLAVGTPPGAPVGRDTGLLVTAAGQPAGGALQVVWDGARHRIAGPAAAAALGLSGEPARQVSPAWLDALPQGADLAVPAPSGSGSAGPTVGGRPTRVGDVLVATLPQGKEYAVVAATGVVPVSALAAGLELAGTPSATSRAVPVAALASAPQAARPAALDRLPAAPLRLADADPAARTLCVTRAVSASGAGAAEVRVAAAAPTGVRPAGGSASAAAPLADAVALPAGSAVLVRAEPAPGVRTGTRYLVTGTGVRFPVADDDALASLGYAGAAPLEVPPLVLDLLPQGPLLSRAAAVAPVPVATAAPSEAPSPAPSAPAPLGG
ncbi:type VII secretion protein EccB [Motilibacter rhizosphaerae]|uniref:Type VII secretion protein EccB n=1 Tax=Motilibacter rhizosphaerae TaxID=598652 RepID=A0A4Q7NU64_9ACTN|nr:type VII secretion protein EccB [Motilibacter rhizosphaerae]RZS90378.1 type VII secretion protein EccB [Motilibacter rhizosphaerae]